MAKGTEPVEGRFHYRFESDFRFEPVQNEHRHGLPAAGSRAKPWAVDRVILLTALPFADLVLPLIPKVFMGDGLKSLAIEAGLWVLLLAVFLPVADSLIV